MNSLARISLAAVVAILASSAAQARNSGFNVEMGETVICDTREQAERLVLLSQGRDPNSAVDAVNEAAKDPAACVVAVTAHFQGDEVAEISSNTFYYRLVRILVVAVATDQGIQTIVPSLFYSIRKLVDRDA
ncbi:MAG TPA: hypothetical protein VFK79_15280 [Xanthobacteraceae bacterium]|nr:hypothetical protein [Xanthobacteraceae bacterium]